jgi:hypothetical protein
MVKYLEYNKNSTPNVVHVEKDIEDGKELHFYSLKEIKKGEEALISYIALEAGKTGYTQKRRDFLKSEFCFDCDCQRCANEMSQPTESSPDPFLLSILCQKDGCKGRLVPDLSFKNHAQQTTMVEAGRTDSGNDIIDTDPVRWKCEACG